MQHESQAGINLSQLRAEHHERPSASTALPLALALRGSGAQYEAMGLLARFITDPRCNERLLEWQIGERLIGPAMTTLSEFAPKTDSVRFHTMQGIRCHLRGDFIEAAGHLRRAAQLEPNNAIALNHLGRALHNGGQPGEAMAAFEASVASDPEYPEAWHNLAHAKRAMGRMIEAVTAFERAVHLAPGYRSARLNLGMTLFNMDRPEDALKNFEALLHFDPNDAEALSHKGVVLHLQGRLHESRSHYEQALRIAPDLPQVPYQLGAVCGELGDFDAARAWLQRSSMSNPDDAETWAELAALEETCNDLQAASNAVDAGLRVSPGHPRLGIEAAKVDRRLGQVDKALKRLRSIDLTVLPPRLKQQYHYELGMCQDITGDAAGAWASFSAANVIAESSLRYQLIDRAVYWRELESLATMAIKGEPHAPPGHDQGDDLIFLIGFPRSGTTLLDTILDALPDVITIEEKPTFETAMQGVYRLPGAYPEALRTSDPTIWEDLRSEYRTALKQYMQGKAARLIVDKLPLRTAHAGILHALFPRAKFLFCARHPGDVIVSNFMQQYSANPAFVNFTSLEGSVSLYERVMSVWDSLRIRLGQSIHYLRYEDLVSDPEKEMQRLCGFLGVQWYSDSLDPDRRLSERGAIRTNSYHQVGERIHQKSVARWRRYREPLEPFIARLAAASAFLGYRFE